MGSDPNAAYKIVSDAVNVINVHVPLKTVEVKAKQVGKPWITSHLVSYIKERHRLFKKKKNTITFGNQHREAKC